MLQTTGSKLTRRSFLRNGALLCMAAAAGLAPRGAFGDTKLAARIAEAEQSHPLVNVLKLASRSLDAMESIKDYQAVVIKKEVVGGKLLSSQMEMKFREEPMGVYLKFIDPNPGREVLYVKGQNNGNMLVHETGIASLVGALEVDPEGKLALEHNRYPITRIGLKNMLTMLTERWLKETKLEGVDVKFYPAAKIGDLSCKVLVISYAEKKDNVRYAVSKLYLDPQTDLPIRLQNYDFPAKAGDQPVLVEDYFYTNMKTNVGFTNIDFDKTNPSYGF
jgi:hypothetical protein